ncbi:retrovirus-related pol polyprotein from transposon TNT 1-94 [Tanacetum coccineum]
MPHKHFAPPTAVVGGVGSVVITNVMKMFYFFGCGGWLSLERGGSGGGSRAKLKSCQEFRFTSSCFRVRVVKNNKLKKALYGLKQAPRAWYDMLSSFLISQDFSKGLVDSTLFIRKEGKELLLVQLYVDDIIFAASTPELCDLFAKIMCLKFKMSMMGKISFFLGLQIFQNPRGVFNNQSKYALESLKKHDFDSCDPVDTPMVEKSKLDEDKDGKSIDPLHYRGMIGTVKPRI